MSHPVSPRPTLYPTTPLKDGAPLSPFSLFSEEKREQFRAAETSSSVLSPAMSFEELARIIAEQWDNLPEESKTPYRERADEERVWHEALSAAMVLTQIGTPPVRSGPFTPVPRAGHKARRCLDIGTPDWQSPRAEGHAAENASSSHHDDFDFYPNLGGIFSDAQTLLVEGTDDNIYRSSTSNSNGDGDGDDEDGGGGGGGGTRQSSPASAAPVPSASQALLPPPFGSSSALFSPAHGRVGGTLPSDYDGSCIIGDGAANSRQGRTTTPASSRKPATSTPAAGSASPTSGRLGGGGSGGGRGGGGVIGLVGFEVRAADGSKVSERKDRGRRSSSQTPVRSARREVAKAKNSRPAAAPARAASRRKRKALFSRPPSFSLPPASSSSSPSPSLSKEASSPTSSSWSAAAAAGGKKIRKTSDHNKRSQEQVRKAECTAGRKLVAKMSKKDAGRPKGPQSSYIWFYKERVALMKATNPSMMSVMDMGTVVGEAWRDLSKEEKLPYTERADADRKRYERELRAIARSAAAAATPDTSAAHASTAAVASDTCTPSAP